MQSMLKKKLWAYIVHNNPDLMLSLQEAHSVTSYLETKVNAVIPMADKLLDEGKPIYVIEELCLNIMTEELKPSRYQYILSVIEEEFPQEFEQMKENGTLIYEVVNLIEICSNLFDDFDFSSENEANRHLRYSIIGQVHDYLA
jgi:hypothetical protein